MHDDHFIKGTERLIDPIVVGTAHFFQRFIGMLPKRAQQRMLERAARKTPHMGFIVEPYAFFLIYRIADEDYARSLLPRGFNLVRTRAFEGDEESYYAIVGLFRLHTSTFWGARAEFYLIAEDERTGLLSWVIVDYLSDTISYDRANGLRAPSAAGAVITTTPDGRVLADLFDQLGQRAVAFDAALESAFSRPLDKRLWIEGNRSIAYGPGLSPDDAAVFALTFPQSEMAEALEVPLDGFRLGRMTWFPGLVERMPAKLACFPFAQHLLCESPR